MKPEETKEALKDPVKKQKLLMFRLTAKRKDYLFVAQDMDARNEWIMTIRNRDKITISFRQRKKLEAKKSEEKELQLQQNQEEIIRAEQERKLSRNDKLQNPPPLPDEEPPLPPLPQEETDQEVPLRKRKSSATDESKPKSSSSKSKKKSKETDSKGLLPPTGTEKTKSSKKKSSKEPKPEERLNTPQGSPRPAETIQSRKNSEDSAPPRKKSVDFAPPPVISDEKLSSTVPIESSEMNPEFEAVLPANFDDETALGAEAFKTLYHSSLTPRSRKKDVSIPDAVPNIDDQEGV
jgi:hypothetical protein